MKIFSSPLLFLVILSIWISILSAAITNQRKGEPSKRKDALKLVGDDENTDVDGRDNTDLEDDDDDDTDGKPDRRNNFPDRNNNRSSISGKRKPYNREYDEDSDDSDELYPPRGRNRKHWKKNKHWKNHPACIKYGKHHPRCRNIRKNDGGHHHHHHRHHHHHHHKRPKHRRPSHDDEDIDDEYFDYNRNSNKGRGKNQGNKNRNLPPRQPDEREQNPKLDGDDDANIVPIDRNNNNNGLQ